VSAATLFALMSCQQPCPAVVEAPPKMTLLVTDVAPSSKGILRITALALNANANFEVVGKSAGPLSQVWRPSPILTGSEVSFLIDGNDTVSLRANGPLDPGESSNRITVQDGKVEVERPTPALVLATRTEFNMVTLLVPGARPEGVQLLDGRGHPLKREDYECLAHPAAPLKEIVSQCWVWFFGPSDGVGFHGAQVQAIVDTPAGPMKTRTVNVR
jgi:hypothetical protein